MVQAINEHTRCAVIHGEESLIISKDTQLFMRHHLGRKIPVVGIPGSQHHVFLDQPIAFVSALRSLLAEWGREGDGDRERASWSGFDESEEEFAQRMKKQAFAMFDAALTKPATKADGGGGDIGRARL